jgi:hypothetical protein
MRTLPVFDKIIPFPENMNQIFSNDDILGMYNIPDEAACILKGHLILEELLDLYCSKITKTDELFTGTFVPFKTKLVISKNLGLAPEAFAILDKINTIRNQFSHRKGHKIEKSQIDSLRIKVNAFLSDSNITPCEEFVMEMSGTDPLGNRKKLMHKWEESDSRLKFIILFINLMIRLVWWIQNDFKHKGIDYSMLPIKFS